MITTVYENTYAAVNSAQHAVRHLDSVVNCLRNADKPMSCGEIGKAIYGNNYGRRAEVTPAAISHVLRNLCGGRFVRSFEVKGEPVQISYTEFVNYDANNNPRKIQVHDDAGNVYLMDNPRYDYRLSREFKEVTVYKTVTPTITVYEWIGE